MGNDLYMWHRVPLKEWDHIEVNRAGQSRNRSTGVIHTSRSDGYVIARGKLSGDRPIKVHILIAMTFLGFVRNIGFVVHHKDHVRHNNVISNLTILTTEEHNALHAREKKGRVGITQYTFDERMVAIDLYYTTDLTLYEIADMYDRGIRTINYWKAEYDMLHGITVTKRVVEQKRMGLLCEV